MKTRTSYLCALCVVGLCLGSALLLWSRDYTVGMLVGSYELDHGYCIETLELAADGTYRQTVKYATGSALPCSGRWQIRDGRELWLDDYAVVDDGFGKPLSTADRGACMMSIRGRGKGVRIWQNEDLGSCFRRSGVHSAVSAAATQGR